MGFYARERIFMDIFAKAAELGAANIPFALATIVASSGSTPRGRAKMIVLADGTSYGTVGGGLVEAKVIDEAKKAIDFDRPIMLDYALDHGPGERSLDMECGGSMQVYVEVFGAKPRLVIAGGGHVGLAIARLASGVGFRIVIVDDRPGYVTAERFPMATELYVRESMDEALAAVPVDRHSCVVIATHAGDERALRSFIARDCAYLGFLGSRRKVRVLLDKALAEGVPEELVDRVRAPIGLDLGAETPEEIAVSVVAEIMAAIAGRDAAPLSGRNGDLVLLRGGGGLATGCALRLRAAGFRVAMLEMEQSAATGGGVAFRKALHEGEARVEGVLARKASSLAEARTLIAEGVIPLLVDPDCSYVEALAPYALVDATLAKRDGRLRRGMAPAVIALGYGFEAGGDVDAVIETQTGHNLGRVLLAGMAAPEGGDPEDCSGVSDRARSIAGGLLEAILLLKCRVKR
jgi:xanthine dehydrogenase accessory factor